MSEAKATPGPWRVEFWATQNGWGIAGRPGKGWVALIAPIGGDVRARNAEEEANARLIAAAPDLLAALEIAASWAMRDGSPCFCPAGRDEDEPKGKMPTLHSTACEMARAAIAKATA